MNKFLVLSILLVASLGCSKKVKTVTIDKVLLECVDKEDNRKYSRVHPKKEISKIDIGWVVSKNSKEYKVLKYSCNTKKYESYTDVALKKVKRLGKLRLVYVD